MSCNPFSALSNSPFHHISYTLTRTHTHTRTYARTHSVVSGTKAGTLSAFSASSAPAHKNKSIRDQKSRILSDFSATVNVSYPDIPQWTRPDNQTGIVSFIANSLASQFSMRSVLIALILFHWLYSVYRISFHKFGGI